MRRLILTIGLAALAVPASAAEPTPETGAELDRMARTMGDPARQVAMARAVGTMAEVILDLPLAPILGPLAEAAGEDPHSVDPDTTLRKVSPGAGDVPRQIERQLPRAMGAIAGMSGAFADLIPQLREVAERVREAMPSADLAELP